jgi:hypothetical protein
MASEPQEPVRFDNNPAIAAEVEREKTETTGDNDSDISEDTRVAQHEHPSDAQQESKLERPGTYDKIEITEEDCYDELGCEYIIPSGRPLRYPNLKNHNPPKLLKMPQGRPLWYPNIVNLKPHKTSQNTLRAPSD